MRTLTSATIAAANSDSSKPYCLLQVCWPTAAGVTAPSDRAGRADRAGDRIADAAPTTGSPTTVEGSTAPPTWPIGTMWYAQEDFGRGDGSTWDNAQGRVLEWGVVRLQLKADKSVNVVGDCTIKLRDEDKVLFNYFQQIEPQRDAGGDLPAVPGQREERPGAAPHGHRQRAVRVEREGPRGGAGHHGHLDLLQPDGGQLRRPAGLPERDADRGEQADPAGLRPRHAREGRGAGLWAGDFARAHLQRARTWACTSTTRSISRSSRRCRSGSAASG